MLMQIDTLLYHLSGVLATISGKRLFWLPAHQTVAVAHPAIVRRGRRNTCWSTQSSFIANANDELFTFCIGKGDFLKNGPTGGGGRPTALPLNPTLNCWIRFLLKCYLYFMLIG